jgi:hypothetical protein
VPSTAIRLSLRQLPNVAEPEKRTQNFASGEANESTLQVHRVDFDGQLAVVFADQLILNGSGNGTTYG